MIKKELIDRNPLRLLDSGSGKILDEGQMGAVVARAGVGKTSFLVQLAMDSLLKGKNVLHISLDQSVKKVVLWYDEVYHNIKEMYQLGHSNELCESTLPHRFIMAFNSDKFTAKRLEERLGDLTEQGIFFPQVMLVDGLNFDESIRETLTEIRLMARDHGFPVWFSAQSKDGASDAEGIPESISHVSDLFEIIIQLQPEGKDVNILTIKGAQKAETALKLDPTTFLVRQS